MIFEFRRCSFRKIGAADILRDSPSATLRHPSMYLVSTIPARAGQIPEAVGGGTFRFWCENINARPYPTTLRMSLAHSDAEKQQSEKRSSQEVALTLNRNETEAHQHTLEFPDGGFQAWSTVVGAWLVLFSTFGFAYAFGVFEDYYVRVYLPDNSPSAIAWIGSVQYMLPYLLAPFVGQIFDSGGFHKLQISGAILFTFSVFMLSLAKQNNYYQIFLAQGIGMGIGLALTFLPSVTIVFHHFKRHRGLASGLVLSGSSIGAAVFPIMINHLLPRLGFGNTLRACGAIIPPCLLVGNCLMRTRLPPHATHNPFAHAKSFFSEPAYVFSVFAVFAGFTGLYFPVVYIQLLSIQHGLSTHLAFYAVTMLNAFGTVFRLLGTHAADRYGPLAVMMVCSVGAGGMIFAMLGLTNAPSLVIISLLYGSFYSTWLALGFPCVAVLAKGPEEIGARGGIALAFGSIGTLISAPIQGALLTKQFHWIRPIVFSATVVLVSGVAWAMTLWLHSKRMRRAAKE
ncbi:MFS general substrate transporter [Mycena indigotica]|uniref:MFS general substrate transporter n=1 Tax=Mycena indigotica TaxID=2126181 RepID=A0A8H6SCD0_9AGAR|nr:MFS general substrate transporter [Mycena indigotica]KAF7296945.1 MFS general substrate transporter [Mycena indigotica]